jgi:seryl-tRNA synthetase
MLDIQYIRDNSEKVKKATMDKGFDGSVVDKLLEVDAERRKIIVEVEDMRARRNKLGKEDIEEAKKLKVELKEKEEAQDRINAEFKDLMYKVPNISADDVKVGTPEENEVIKTVGEIPKFDFPVRDHLDIGKLTDSIDFESGAKVAQSGFFYFKNDLALLELALAQYAFEKLSAKGFTPVITPNVAKERNIVGCGFQARSDKERQIYHIEDEDLDLIATAEITLVGMHTDEVFNEQDLPKKYVGYSSCYRKEIGSYGKDVRGILRVHEFKKVEMVVFCKPEDSEKIHEELLAIEEEIYQELGIAYQVIKMVTGDLGNAASKKYDLEAWMPSQNKYREITSTSNTTDFQARRLNIKYRTNNENKFVHTLNGTVSTTSRTIIAILENFQNADGSVNIPKVLQKWMGKEKIEVKTS